MLPPLSLHRWLRLCGIALVFIFIGIDDGLVLQSECYTTTTSGWANQRQHPLLSSWSLSLLPSSSSGATIATSRTRGAMRYANRRNPLIRRVSLNPVRKDSDGDSAKEDGSQEGKCPFTGGTSAAKAEKAEGATTTSSSTTRSEIGGGDGAAIRGPKKLPFMAGVKFLMESAKGRTHHYMYRLMREHGDCFMIWNKYVVLNDVRAIRDVLETHNLEKPEDIKRGYRSMFYDSGGIVGAPWDRWVKERRMLAPALSEKVIGELAPKFRIGSAPALRLLRRAADSKAVVDMDQIFTATAFDTIGLVVLGRTFGRGEEVLESYATALRGGEPRGDQVDDAGRHRDGDGRMSFLSALQFVMAEAVRQMTLPLWFTKRFGPSRKVRRARDCIDLFLEDCIGKRLQEREEAVKKGGADVSIKTDLLNILLDAEEEGVMTRNDVKGQLLTFLFGGHDTTGHTMSWLLYHVSVNDDLQEMLHEEAKEVLPNVDDFIMDSKILQRNLPLLDMVWQETNRMHPATATGTSRQVGDRPLVVDSYDADDHGPIELPPNTCVSVPSFALHRNEKYWPEPHVFDPYRFAKENAEKRDPMAFQAFSAGPRSCIGARLARAETLTVIAAILRRYRVTNVETVHPPEDYMSLTCKPKNGIHFTFEERVD